MNEERQAVITLQEHDRRVSEMTAKYNRMVMRDKVWDGLMFGFVGFCVGAAIGVAVFV